MSWLVCANGVVGKLGATMTAGAGTATLRTGDGALFPSTFPYRVTIGAEIVEVTGRTGDALSVTRAREGTVAVGHASGVNVGMYVTAGIIQEIQAAIDAGAGGGGGALAEVVRLMLGAADGIVRADGSGKMAVTQTDPASLSVLVLDGGGMVDGVAAALTEPVSVGPVTAAVTSARIDLVRVDADGAVDIVTGSEGGGEPNAGSGYLALAALTVGVGVAALTDADIDDRRMWL